MTPRRYREFLSVSLQPGVRLFALESRRFKTVSARFLLVEPIREQTATANALLPFIMRAGSHDHPSRRALADACEELYGLSTSVSVTRFADAQVLVASAEFPADRFLPKGAKELERALKLVVGQFTRPALNRNGSALRAEIVEQEKAQLAGDLNALQNNKPTWAAIQAARSIYAGTPAAIYEYGRVEQLAELTAEQLLERHRLLIGNAQIYAFVTGPVKPERALHALARALDDLPRGRRTQLPPAVRLKHRKTPQRPRRKLETEQTHLVHAWSGGAVYGDAGYEAQLFASGIFGGFSFSRLFKIVREEHGLAYAISSHYHRARGTMVSQAAVDPGKAADAVRLIRKEFNRLRKSGPTRAEFDACRQSLIESRRSAWDSPGARVSDCVFQAVLGFRQSPERQLSAIRKVTPAQVKAALQRLRPHTEFRMAP